MGNETDPGALHWTAEQQSGMVQVEVGGREYLTYGNLKPNIYRCLANTAKRLPEKAAFVDAKATITFRDLLCDVDRLAGHLKNRYEIHKGDVCAILCVNSIDFCIAFYAYMKLGVVALPLSTKQKSNELAYQLEHSNVRLLIMDETWLPNVANTLERNPGIEVIFSSNGDESRNGTKLSGLLDQKPQTDEAEAAELADVAAIVYTSGTLGVPKGACITHFGFLHAVESYRRALGVTQEDSTIIPIPIFNITGLCALMGLFVDIGGTAYLQPFFNAEQAVKMIEDHKITFLHASPTVFIKLLEVCESNDEIGSVRCAACGSSNLPMEVLRKLRGWLPNLHMHTVYGLTETTSPFAIMPDDPILLNKPGSSGIPIPGNELRIWNDQANREAAPGEVGSILVSGSTVIQSYWNATPEQTQVFCDGWFDTGDIGMVDIDGYLYVLDRKKDMINRGGEKIYSLEVENILSCHPDVRECAVVGIPDPVMGERVYAAVRLMPGKTASESDMKKYLYQKLATYKLPERYCFLCELPRMENGKINKRLLREMIKQ